MAPGGSGESNMRQYSHIRDLHFHSLWKDLQAGSGVGHDFHDVTFLILNEAGQRTGEVKAHKMVLSLVSEIFRAQFSGRFAELKKQETGITIVEIRQRWRIEIKRIRTCCGILIRSKCLDSNPYPKLYE